MRVTVCEFPSDPDRRDDAFAALAEHTRAAESELVLLPEMPFSSWLAATDEVDPARWTAAVDEHERWMERLPELGARAVLGTRPVVDGDARFNEAFAWEPTGGARGALEESRAIDGDGDLALGGLAARTAVSVDRVPDRDRRENRDETSHGQGDGELARAFLAGGASASRGSSKTLMSRSVLQRIERDAPRPGARSAMSNASVPPSPSPAR